MMQVQRQRAQGQCQQAGQRDLPYAVRGFSYDLTVFAADHKAIQRLPVAIGRDPDRQQRLSILLLRKLTVDRQAAMGVAGNVGGTALDLKLLQAALRSLPALLKVYGVLLCREASQVARRVRHQPRGLRQPQLFKQCARQPARGADAKVDKAIAASALCVLPAHLASPTLPALGIGQGRSSLHAVHRRLSFI